MTAKLRDYLKDAVVVFDIDGVLASYEFGDCIHTADVWEEAFVSEDDNPYCNVGPLPALQDFVENMPSENVFVCSVAGTYEELAKRLFVKRNYPSIPDENIYFVPNKNDKLAFLEKISKTHLGKNIAIVDDTVKTLDSIHQASNFTTVHITSFFD